MTHDHAPFAFHKQVLAYAFTADRSALRGWKFMHVEAANGTDIHFDDGSVHTFCSRQDSVLGLYACISNICMHAHIVHT